jgi:hypothetical protein
VSVEESHKVIDDDLPSQVWAWLDVHVAADNEEHLAGGISDRIGGISDLLPLVLGMGFVTADAAVTLMGHGDLISLIAHLAGH